MQRIQIATKRHFGVEPLDERVARTIALKSAARVAGEFSLSFVRVGRWALSLSHASIDDHTS